jgi:hypothetical protein
VSVDIGVQSFKLVDPESTCIAVEISYLLALECKTQFSAPDHRFVFLVLDSAGMKFIQLGDHKIFRTGCSKRTRDTPEVSSPVSYMLGLSALPV